MPAVLLFCFIGVVTAAVAPKPYAVPPSGTSSVGDGATRASRGVATANWPPAPQPAPSTDVLEFVDPVEVFDRSVEIAKLKDLVNEEVQPAMPSPRPRVAIPGREDSGVTGPLIDPEELSDSPEAPAGHAATQQGPAPLASPSPVASSSRKLPDFFAEPEELLKSDKGVLLSVPLTPAEQAKAMSETATALCDNTCGLSYDGVCSDGATSTAYCSGAEAFPAAGRGSCQVAESNECEMGTDCARSPSASF